MSTTSDRLGAQANEVSNDLKEMGGIVRDAAQEKLEQVRENATEYYEQRRDKSTAHCAPSSNTFGSGRSSPY